MAEVVIDASVWVSRMLVADAAHTSTLGWFERETSGGGAFVAPTLILAEVAGALARVTNRAEAGRRAADELIRLPAIRFVSVDDVVGVRAAELAAVLRLRGADAVYVAVAESLGLPLVSWDAEQRARASKIIRTLTPS